MIMYSVIITGFALLFMYLSIDWFRLQASIRRERNMMLKARRSFIDGIWPEVTHRLSQKIKGRWEISEDVGDDCLYRIVVVFTDSELYHAFTVLESSSLTSTQGA